MKRNGYLYRKIWVDNNGKIPKDENGISYEIHHINNDKTDNRIENLACVSLQEHFDIHYEQGDYRACQLIAGRMNNPTLGKQMSDEFKKKQSEIQKAKVLDGTHHLLGGEIQKKSNKDRVQAGTHNFQTEESRNKTIKRNMENVLNRTHSLIKKADGSSVGGDITLERIKNGTHHFLDSEKQKELSMRAKIVNQKSVYKISLDGIVLKEYQSVKDILIENPDYKMTIYHKIKSGKEYKGYIWKYK